MSEEERKIALYCLKANSDYHSEVCEECINYPNCDHTIQDDVTETIIKALEQEPCEDAISRADAKKYLSAPDANGDRVIYESDLDLLPPVTPQPKIGHWINDEDMTNWYDATYKCSCCGREIIIPYESRSDLYKNYPYCHCGIKMQEV